VTEYLHQTARYHRGHLHAALAKHVPSEIIHLRKQIIDVEVDPSQGVSLKFKDGSTATADILLGADGLHSVSLLSPRQAQKLRCAKGVRQLFVPDFELKWSGWTAFRGTFDASLVELIPDLPEDSTHWWGPTTSFFASQLGKNSFSTVGSVFGDPEDPIALYKDVSWDEDASLKAFQELYKVILMAEMEMTAADLEAGLESSCKEIDGTHTKCSILPELFVYYIPRYLGIRRPSNSHW